MTQLNGTGDATLRLRAYVRHSDGTPVSGAVVPFLVTDDNGNTSTYSVTTGADGYGTSCPANYPVTAQLTISTQQVDNGTGSPGRALSYVTVQTAGSPPFSC